MAVDQTGGLEQFLEGISSLDPVLENLNEAILITDLEGMLRACNERYCIGVGASRAQLLGKPPITHVVGEVHKRLVVRKIREAADGVCSRFNVPGMRGDGTRIWAEVRLSPLRDATGRIVGTISATSDITTTKEGQEKLEDAVRHRTNELRAAIGQLKHEIEERHAAEVIALGQKRVLCSIMDALIAEPDIDAFFDMLLRSINETLKVPSSGLWMRVGQSRWARLYTSCSDVVLTSPVKSEADVRLNAAAYQDLFVVCKPHAVDVTAAMPSLPRAVQELYGALGIKRTLAVPLLRSKEAIGFISIRRRVAEEFSESETELVVALADQAALAVEMRRLSEQSRQAAILEERNRLAREIHDTLAQACTGIMLHTNAAERDLVDEEPDRAIDHIRKARELAKEGLAEARRSVQALRPIGLERGDLVYALGELVGRMSVPEFPIAFKVMGEPFPIDPLIEENLLRISQEALGNAARHSGADRTELQLDFANPRVLLKVTDNGRGFEPKTSQGAGFGLESMRDRAISIGLKFTMRSKAGKGTTVTVKAEDAAPK